MDRHLQNNEKGLGEAIALANRYAQAFFVCIDVMRVKPKNIVPAEGLAHA